jgi:hypothetical protein
MKHLILPTFAVVFSTVGCAYGCHASGMPLDDVAIATALAGSVSSVTAFGALLLAHVRRTTTLPGFTARKR